MNKSRKHALLITAATVASLAALAVVPPGSDAAVKLTRLATFDDPVETVAAPGPSSRELLFVAERAGVIRVVRDGEVLPRPFLDISGLVKTDELEQGLLSIAFDPRYEVNGRLYAYYADNHGSIRIARFVRDEQDPLRADPYSSRTVLAIPHPDSGSHYGGRISFGPDRNLWVSTGDGHPYCDPPENAQNTDVLLGKLLRIDPVGHGYAIPPDNPFVGTAGADEVYAYGLRNPFRYSIDPRMGGTIAIGDVGQFRWEEINVLTLAAARGANFGWDAYEGYVPLALEGPCGADLPTAVPVEPVSPALTYPHSVEDPRSFYGCATIGGVIVRDPRLPAAIRGRLIYSDYCRGRLRSFIPRGDPALASDDQYVGLRVDQPVAISAARQDQIYVTTRLGPVFRIDPVRTSDNQPQSSR